MWRPGWGGCETSGTKVTMLQVEYDPKSGELLFDGHREDYRCLLDVVRQVVATGAEQIVSIVSSSSSSIAEIVVRRRSRPNRVSIEGGRVVIEIAPEIAESFLSFLQFPDDADLPEPPMRCHHHYDAFADDETYVAADSASVVFALTGDRDASST